MLAIAALLDPETDSRPVIQVLGAAALVALMASARRARPRSPLAPAPPLAEESRQGS